MNPTAFHAVHVHKLKYYDDDAPLSIWCDWNEFSYTLHCFLVTCTFGTVNSLLSSNMSSDEWYETPQRFLQQQSNDENSFNRHLKNGKCPYAVRFYLMNRVFF